MSMISAQIDELRELAGDGSMEWSTGPIRASVLREAADTIWELRDDLQRANAENAKLQEELEAAKHDLSLFSGELVASKFENAKLREKIKALTELASIGKLTASQCTELAEDNAKLRELLQRALTSHNKICTNRGTCAGCLLFKAKPLAPACPIISVTRDARELGVDR